MGTINKHTALGGNKKLYERFFKRFIDVLLSLLGLIILFVPMLIIAIIIKIDSPGPILFKQKRIGYRKKSFTIYKYRSMPVDTPSDIPTHLLHNERPVLSTWQRLLRTSSADELPQLINIFKGDMSVIGPRPALWNQDNLIAERDKYGANDIKPGLTGWAQINGRDTVEIEDKARFDGYYLQNAGLLFDMKIFFLTIVKVLKRECIADRRPQIKSISIFDEKKQVIIK